MKLLEKIGIYGWKTEDENLILSSLLTGDPLLMIGTHGSAKTHIGYKIADALKKKFISYDASKSLFEDVLGFPSIEALKAGKVEYIQSAVTVWDKDFVLVDEINRAVPELQAKWLEIIRSRKIMGFPTSVKWVWAAMNPMNTHYNGTQMMDAALIGRFAIFLYPPETLEMEESDRIKVVQHINGDDAPSISEWIPQANTKTISPQETVDTGKIIKELLQKAGQYFVELKEQFSSLGEFLSRFCVLTLKETGEKVKLDGRRLGFIYRNILAYRAVALARKSILGDDLEDFSKSAKSVILSSIPIGLNEDGINKEEFLHKIEICLDLLAEYFSANSELSKTELIYRLFTTSDLLEKTRILLSENLSELAKSKAWNDLTEKSGDISILAYVALQVEARRPGTIPNELLEKLSKCVKAENLNSSSIAPLKDASVEYIEEFEELLKQQSDLEKMAAFQRLRELSTSADVNPETIKKTKKQIQRDSLELKKLLNTKAA